MNNWKEEFDKQFVEVDSHPAILLNSASDAIGASMYIRQITFISELLEIQNEKFIKDLDRLSRYSRNDADIENIQDLNDCYKKNRDSRLSFLMMDVGKVEQDAYKRGLEDQKENDKYLICVKGHAAGKQEGIKEGLERALELMNDGGEYNKPIVRWREAMQQELNKL